MESNIKLLFEPRNVAVVGASTNPAKIGYRLVQNIVTSGYEGGIYPVNPRGGEVLGHPSVKSVRDIEVPIDLACIAVPSQYVFDAVKDCADKGVGNVAIITSGFSEVGNAEEEHKIAEYAKERGTRILGPNIFGIYVAHSKMNATFSAGKICPGHVAIVTQSGAIGIAMIGKTAAENIGLSAIVSVGNKADIDESDLLDYLVDDPQTKTILMYIEGVKDGVRFVETLKRATVRKPVVVIKSGRSKRGAVAVASHTGSLAGSDEIFDSIMRQCGVLRAESIQEAFNWATFLAESPPLDGENCTIVTNGGGIGVMATDACEKYGIKLYDDAEVLVEKFRNATPELGSVKNPIDITGAASGEDYKKALQASFDYEDFHSCISLYCETATMDERELAQAIEEKYRVYEGKKPVVFSLFGGEELVRTADALRKKGVPVYNDVYEAVSVMGALYFTHAYRKRAKNQAYARDLMKDQIDIEAVRKIVAGVRKDSRNFLLAPEAQDMMRAAGIPVPESRIAKNLKQAVEYAEEIGYPVVMKVVSRDILHKSDAGGVALDLLNKEEVLDAYQAIMHNCRQYDRSAKIDGIEIAKMVKPGVETIIGARRDSVFGPILMFGLGGIYVEVMKDVAFRSLPITKREVNDMISEIRSYPLLLGVRGEAPKDIQTIHESLLKVGALIQLCEDITDIEINPLVAYEQGEGCLALDARILIANPKE